MKNERLMAMLDCLLNEGRKTAEELSARFEVSVRTVYRDVDSLCSAGVPLVAFPGGGGGYEIEEGYRIDRSFLSKEEIADLSSLLKGFAEATKDKSLARSLGKLSSLGPRGAEAASGGLPPPLLASLSAWGAPGPDPRLVFELRRAIAEHRPVSFSYRDGEGRSSARAVEPFTIAMGGTSWYLHGWCRLRGGFRLFKLARVADLVLLGDRFDPRRRAPVPDPFAFGFSGEVAVPVVLDVEPCAKMALDEAVPMASVEEGGELGLTYRFDYPIGSWLARLLLSVGGGFRVREPETLRRAIAEKASEVARLNSDR